MITRIRGVMGNKFGKNFRRDPFGKCITGKNRYIPFPFGIYMIMLTGHTFYKLKHSLHPLFISLFIVPSPSAFILLFSNPKTCKKQDGAATQNQIAQKVHCANCSQGTDDHEDICRF
jgi:hypothetical protein